ncbi:MAG: hypothetical protein WC765_00660 [Phycisphaerae bacterium]|jgi:hypothetical protein
MLGEMFAKKIQYGLKVKKLKTMSTKVLLFDDQYTENKHGFKTTLNPARRIDGAVLYPDQPWECAGFCGDSGMTVLKEDGIYKMWYMISNPEPETPKDGKATQLEMANLDLQNVPKKFMADISCSSRYYLCYATSNDGVVWKKDHLGVYEVLGNKNNNIVFSGRLSATVFIDPTTAPDKKYKMIHGGSIRLPHWHKQQNKFIRMAYTGIYGAYSADGIHWQSTEKPIIPWYTDTTNVCYWDERIKKYVAYVRVDKDMIYDSGKTLMLGPGHDTYRLIARTESDDFENFPPPQIILEPRPEEVENYLKDYGKGIEDKGLDFYNTAAIKYPFSEGVYLLFPSYLYHESDTAEVHIATSRDGIHYTRHDEPFVRLGEPGAFDKKQMYMAAGMIKEQGRLSMYYVGYDCTHGATANDYKGAIGRVGFRLDGFGSQDAGNTESIYTTVPIKVTGSCINLNVETLQDGFVKVALLMPSGEGIPGKTFEDADVITGEHHDARVSWQGSSDVTSLIGQDVKICFVGKSVKLYSFEFSS